MSIGELIGFLARLRGAHCNVGKGHQKRGHIDAPRIEEMPPTMPPNFLGVNGKRW
jgi:hypothetical protein